MEDENDRFDAILIWVGDRKINVLKLVRELTGLGNAEAKHFIEHPPQTVKANLTLEEGRALRSRFQDLGAHVDLKESARP